MRMSWTAVGFMFVCCFGHSQAAQDSPSGDRRASATTHRHGHAKKRVGKASVYSHKFDGRKTADGTRLEAESNTAASKTLPLGTTARVKNLENGSSTVVEIKDRGPHVKGRIVDVSPKSARELGIDKNGVAPVEVTPLQIPSKDQSKDEAQKTANKKGS